MRFWRRSISATVMAAIVLLPFLSMAMCVPQVNAPMQCPPDCPMMAKINMGHHGMEMKSSKTPGSCCEFRSSTPVPVTEYKTVTPVYSVEPVIASSPVVSTSMIRPVAILEASPPSLPVDSQAQLCTFLI